MVNKRDDLGYLGLEFQYRLAHHFMDDKKFFRDVFEIVDNNMFTEGNLKQFIGSMKNYYSTYEHVPSYDELEIEMRSKSRNEQDLEFIVATIEKVKETTISGGDSIKDKAHKFFKQQNLIKVTNQINEIIKFGDVDRYPECEELIRHALMVGNKDEIGVKLRDNIGEVLSEDYRKTIPTGVDGIDESLEGGLGKGELGVIIGPSGFGKEQPISELVCTPNGFKTMGSIEVGDYVTHASGKPVRVNATFPQGVKDVYKVTFSDNVSVECGIDHLWNVNSYYQRIHKKYVKGAGAKGKKVYNPDHSFKTMSLRQILDKGLYRGGKNSYNFKVPMPSPVEFNEISIPNDLHPYLLGAFIGDGCFSRMDITTKDQEVVDEIKRVGNVVSVITREKRNNIMVISLSYLIKNSLYKYFTLKEKSGDKFIPHDYLYNTIENRIELLNGLMDTDGTCQKNGCSCYNTKSKQLAEDVRILVLSLGGFATVREKKASYFNEKYNKRVDCGIHYEVTITLVDPTIPIYKLKRKQERVHYRILKKGERFIKSIDLVRQEESKCITVDSEDGLYLTRDFIVTHNTSLSTCYINHAASIGFKALQIVFEDKEKQIQRKHFGRITGIESRNLSKPENIEMVSEIIHNTDKFDDNLIIKKFNTGEATVPMIKNYIKKLINTGFKPDMVVIDYFECIVPTKQYKDVYQSEGHTMRELESLASDLDFALWVPTQGTKDSLGLDVVTMDKAGGSFKKIQIAHVVMSIARSLEDIENNIATIAILKNRSGKSGAVMEGIYFNNGTCTIDTSRANIFSDHSKWVEAEKERMEDMTSDLMKSINERRNNNK